MKKLIGIVAALAVFFAQQACSEGDDPAPGIRLSTETLDFPAGKSTLDLVVSCPQQGREALITLTGADGTVKTVTVTQGAAEELSPVIKSFRFRTAANAAKLPQDVVLEVGDGIISGRTSFVVEDKVLVPEFEFEGGGVYLGAQEVVSGETEVDFSGPVVLTVRNKGGGEREYRVSLVSFTGLPVVYIDTGGIPVVSKEEYVAASLKVVDNNGLRPSGVFRGDVNIKGRGNSTWGMPKKPYRLKFDKKQSLLGEPKDKSWVLLANYMDNACGIRNATAYAIGHLSCLEFTPTTHFVDVFLNDRYNGTYQLCEHMKISEDRVNVTDEGYLLEADQLDRLSPDDVYFRTERILMNIKDPDVEPGSPQYEWIRNYVNEAENALYGADFADPETGYAKYLNVDTYVDWYVISEITKTNDASLYTSCYMNIAPGGKLNMGPIWDFDICMGNTKWNGTDGRGPEGYWNRESPWFERMLQDPAFVRKVKERIGYFKSNLAVILAQVDGEAAYAEASVVEDNRLWHNLKPEGGTGCRPVFPGASRLRIAACGAPPLPMRRVRYAGRIPGGESPPAGNMQRCMLCQKNLYLHEHKHYHYESIAYKRQPPQGGEHFYRLVRGCPDARSGRHRGGDRPHRDEGHAGLYRLREMCGTGALRLFRCRVYRRAGEACPGRRPCGRLAGLLCRAERFALRAARPRVLFVRPRSGLQACRSRGCLPPWRGECDVRPPEQVFYDFEYARRVVAILEQRTRTGAARSARRCRRLADDAGAGEEHGATAEGRRRPPSGPGTRRTGVDAFHPLTAAGLDFRMGKSAQKRELATTVSRCQFPFNV